MKHRITSEDIACLVPVLNNILDGAYLSQIYDGMQDGTKIIIMKFRKKVEDRSIMYYLLLESGIRIHTIESFTSIRQYPSGCVGKLRKEVRHRRLFPIKQVGTDRILEFCFSNEKHFIIEFFDRGNFIVTDNDYVIIYITRPYKFNEIKLDIGIIYPKDEIAKAGFPLKNDISQAKGYLIDKENFSGLPFDTNKQFQEFDNINIAMQKYFTYEVKVPKDIIKKKKRELNKDEKRKMNIENQISKLDKNKEMVIDSANNLISKIDIIQVIIDIINDNIYKKVKYPEIEFMLKNQFREFENIIFNHEHLILDNIKLDYNVSAYVNVSKIYSENKIIKRKIERAEDVILNMQPSKIVEVKEKLVVNRKHMKFENYWWFIIDNIVIMCGKSADDNEVLLNNVDPSDIIIHGHFDKSPWAVIKNPNKIEIPFKVIAYAGDFVVQRSWNWTEHYANQSYYTYPNKISKSAPSGEFMGKGSRMVHEKNLLSITNLEMGVGIIFKSENNYLHTLDKDTHIDFAMVICAPYSIMTDYIYKIKVKPSGKKNDKGRKKLILSIISKILNTKCKSVISKDYIKAIPFDEWDKTCIRTFSL